VQSILRARPNICRLSLKWSRKIGIKYGGNNENMNGMLAAWKDTEHRTTRNKARDTHWYVVPVRPDEEETDTI
jgi:hypothetical protein